MAIYPTVCKQLTDGCAPSVCAVSSLAVNFETATIASLCTATASVNRGLLSNLFMDAGSLGAVDGAGNVAVQQLDAQSGASITSVDVMNATIGTLDNPSTTTFGGAAMQPEALILPAFVNYVLPPTTPHLTQIVAVASVYANGILSLPEAVGLTPFPPPGYRLFIHNMDAAANAIVLKSTFFTIQYLSGAVVVPASTLSLAGRSNATVVWTGTIWLASISA